jgi:hypothetical protein
MATDEYTPDQHLLFLIHDQLAIANWQRTKDGSKGRNRPKPLSPLAKANAESRDTTYGKPTVTQEEVYAHLRALGHDC